jgi:hypothetical protein
VDYTQKLEEDLQSTHEAAGGNQRRESWLAEDEPQEETAILEIEEEAIFTPE